jgi:hypothetical protein
LPPDTYTPVIGDPWAGGVQFQLTPVEGNPFMALQDYAKTLPNLPAQPPIGQPGGAPLDDFAPPPASTAAPQPAIPALAAVASDPSRSMAVRLPAAIGSSLADQGVGLAKSAWGAATLPGDVAKGLIDPSSPEAIRRSTDLAGLLTLPSVGAEANPDVLNAGGLSSAKGKPSLPVKPSPDDVYDVGSSNFTYPKLAGNKIVSIDDLTGGVRMNDPGEQARVAALVSKMQGPDGYISRLITDQDGNVLEGQHRLEALRAMGETRVPVSVVKDLSNGYDVGKIQDTLKSIGGLGSDQRNQIMQRAFDVADQAGSPAQALQDYELPPPYDKHFNAALTEMAAQKAPPPPVPVSSPGGPQFSLTPVDHDPFAGAAEAQPPAPGQTRLYRAETVGREEPAWMATDPVRLTPVQGNPFAQ